MLKGKIGLEIHAYPVTREKLFCKCIASREKGVRSNINICPICAGQPGAKPMLPNKSAVEKAVLIGLMLGCKINEKLVWQRKHYDWPDLPKGYQNTLSGTRAFPVGVNGEFGGIGIWSMHLEEDPASWEPSTGCVDYNRSGLPLVEIVTAPDFTDADGVMKWLRKLIHHLSYLKIIDSDAGIKVDVNVNILGKSERVEIKNINSIENIGMAIKYELERQAQEGGKVKETRRFDAEKNMTEVMRSKEGAQDYRFISDPDLQDIILDKKFVEGLRRSLPESPDVKLERLTKKYKIDKKNAEVLAKNIDLVEFFEKVADKIEGGFALPWITVELLRVLNYNRSKLDRAEIRIEDFVELLRLVKEKKITELQGKQMLNQFYPKSFNPMGKVQGKITDEKELEKVAKKMIERNEKAVKDYKSGDAKALNFLMGEMMKETQKRADFAVAKKVLEKLLK